MTLDKRLSQQDIENQGADRLFDGFPMREIVEYSPAPYNGNPSLTRKITDQLAERYDVTTTADTVYEGYAAIGSDESNAVWQIKKTNTSTLIVEWADGDNNFNNIWDDRASLSYS